MRGICEFPCLRCPVGPALNSIRRVPPIRIQDTLSGEVRELEPREPGKVVRFEQGPDLEAALEAAGRSE